MELNDEQRIKAPRDTVYAALNDPEILKQCIPGCETLEKHSDTEMEATVVLKIGPVKAKFKGSVRLENLNPPESYTIVGEGQGGAAGFAKGGADVELVADGEETILKYAVKADVGGKVAQIGSRLLVSTSKKLAGNFFESFAKIVEGEDETEEAPAS
ncbi:MAG: carbon monoxide dehydrogenase subunit G [Pseudomonadota bacterium]